MPGLLEGFDDWAKPPSPETGSLLSGAAKAAEPDGLLGGYDDWLKSKPVRLADQENRMAAAREWVPEWLGSHKELGGVTVRDILDTSIPFVSAGRQVVQVEGYKSARKAYDEGKATDEQLGEIAKYELLQQRAASRGIGQTALHAAAGLPAIAGEMLLPAGLGVRASAGAGLGRQALTRAAQGALTPSLVAPTAEQRSVEQGGEAYDPKNLAPAVAIAAIKGAILGTVGPQSAKVPTLLGRTAAGTALGIGENQAGDALLSAADQVLPEAYQTKTKWGTVGSFLRGENGEGFKHLAADAVAFGAFAALHGREEVKPVEALAKAVDAGETPESLTAAVQNPDTAKGPAKDFADAVIEARKEPETKKPANPLDVLTKDELKGLSDQLGWKVSKLREHANEPWVANWIDPIVKSRPSEIAPEAPPSPAEPGPAQEPVQDVNAPPRGAQEASGTPEQASKATVSPDPEASEGTFQAVVGGERVGEISLGHPSPVRQLGGGDPAAAKRLFPDQVQTGQTVARINGIIVDPAHQKKGYGQQLYLEGMAKNGADWFYNSQADPPAVQAIGRLVDKGLVENHWQGRPGGAHLMRLTEKGREAAGVERRGGNRPPQGVWEAIKAEHPDWSVEQIGREAARQADEGRIRERTNPLTGIPNRKAFDESKSAFVGMSDADGLKAFNDKFGYEHGNALLQAKAEALKRAGLDAYHEKGDEFLARGETAEEVARKYEQARAILRDSIIRVTMPDGSVRRFKGADFSYGVGHELSAAEAGLKAHKAEREARGERARGELRGITELGPEAGAEGRSLAPAKPAEPQPQARVEAPVASAKARFEAGQPVGFDEVAKEKGLTALEAHVVRERTAGRSFEEIARDPEAAKPNGKPYTRQRIEQIERAAGKKLGLSESVRKAVHDKEQVERGRVLTEQAARVMGKELSADPEEVKAASRKAVTVEEKIDARLDDITTQFLEGKITREEVDRLVAEVTASRQAGRAPEPERPPGLQPNPGPADPGAVPPAALGARPGPAAPAPATGPPAGRPRGLGRRVPAELAAPAVESRDIPPGLPLPPNETGFRGGAPFNLGQQGRPAKEFALAREKTTQERAARGEQAVLDAVKRSNPEAWDAALAKMKADPEAGKKLVDELAAKARPTTSDENALLLQRKVALNNERDAARMEQAILRARLKPDDPHLEPGRRAIEDLDVALNQLDKVVAAAGTELGRGLQFYRQLAKEDYSLSRMLAGAESAKRGPLTPEEKAEITALHDRIRDLEAELEKVKDGGKTPEGKDKTDVVVEINKQKGKYKEKIDAFDRTNWSRGKKVWEDTKETSNLFRAFKTAYDVSAVLRQGGILTGSMLTRRPVQVAKNVTGMIRDMMSEHHYDRAQFDVLARPNAKLYKEAGLYLADLPGVDGKKEESFAGKWPVLRGRLGIAAAERAYNGYLNRLRADTFDFFAGRMARSNVPTPAELKTVANYVNVATGRGALPGSLEKAADAAAHVLFSPRFMASRFQLLAGQPFYQGTGRTRRLIAEDLARSLGALGIFYALVKAADKDAEITFDPRSADFAKIKFGNFRLDPLAGLSQTAVFLTRMATGETKSTTTGKVTDLRGPDVPHNGPTQTDVLTRFARNKLAPLPAIGVDVLTGQTAGGDKAPTPGSLVRLTRGLGKKGEKDAAVKELRDIASPISVSDVYDSLKDQGVPRGVALSLAALLGMGTQLYEKRTK